MTETIKEFLFGFVKLYTIVPGIFTHAYTEPAAFDYLYDKFMELTNDKFREAEIRDVLRGMINQVHLLNKG